MHTVTMSATVLDIHFLLSVFHLLILAPLLLFVSFQRAATPRWLYTVLFSLGSLLAVYHGWRGMIRWQAQSSRTWVNLFHVFAVAPLFLYIGYLGEGTPRAAYELLLILTWGLVGYHLFNLVRLLEAHPADVSD